MVAADTVYIGINPVSSRKDYFYAILDQDLNLLEMQAADGDMLISRLAEQHSGVVAVNAPSGVNRGVLRASLAAADPSGDHQFRGVDIRLAEYVLRQKGIKVSGTPSREELCPGWIQSGFRLYEELSKLGYQSFPSEQAALSWIETHPYACFCVLLEAAPFPQPTLEGRLQRQLVLHEKGVRINDPMEFFEEITRFKLLNGILPLDTIFTFEQLDVLVAAYTAWTVDTQMNAFSLIGDAAEGRMALPVKELGEKY